MLIAVLLSGDSLITDNCLAEMQFVHEDKM